jgi:mono/diheme cytochrome c family protein
MRTRSAAALGSALALIACTTPAPSPPTRYNLGHAATPAELAAWDIDIAPDGKNLPDGSGTVASGRTLFAERCAACHGKNGEGGVGDRLQGGKGTLATETPVKTVGSYWPYATTLFDYIRRAMPLNAPQSLSSQEVYAVSGYVLFLNGLVAEDATIDAQTLIALKMPNRDGFVDDPRPDVRDTACQKDCAK